MTSTYPTIKYLLNVAKQDARLFTMARITIYRFYCRIELSAQFESDAIEQERDIVQRFPSSEGFKFDLYHTVTKNKAITITD